MFSLVTFETSASAMSLGRAYTRQPVVVGALAALVSLALLFALDNLLGQPMGLRYIYLLPIWLATRLGGRVAGLSLALVTALVLLVIDARSTIVYRPEQMTLNFTLRVISMTILTLIIAQVEDALRKFNRLAKHDPLTGLLNRRALTEFGFHAIDRARRLHRPLTVVVVDCDRFKFVNDRYGHAAGDEVLRTMARILENDARNTDIVARIGGDEFVVVLQNTSRVGAKVYIDRIQTEFAREAGLLGFDIALSAGVAELGPDGRTIVQLVERADREMYARKVGRQAARIPA